MDHLSSQKQQQDSKSSNSTEFRKPSAPAPDDLSLTSDDLNLSNTPPNLMVRTPAMIQNLQQTIGNQAVQRLIDNKPVSNIAGIAPFRIQREGETEDTDTAPEVKTPKKEMIDKAKAVTVLQDAFKDYVKKIEGGKVEVLAQSDFQAAYDKIYGKTKYSWDKYVKPGPGNLEGFAYKGTNYINKDTGSVDVVPHEMLHNNTASSWTGFAGSELDEGTTEYLTIKAVTKAKYTPSHSYPDQEGVVQELVKMTSEDLLMKAYFKGETDALKTAMESKCKGSWSDFKKAMQAKKWTKAKGFLKAKETK